MKNIKKIVRTDAAFEILDNSNCAGTDWGSGGCAILAQALNRLGGYPIVVIYNLDYEGPEHFGVITPSGTILDHDGEHKNSSSWLRFFIDNEHYRSGALTVKYYTPNMNMDGVKFDSEASDKLAELIKNYNMIRETIRSVLRENSIKEVALREKDLPSSVALFIREINQGYDLVLYDPKIKEIYGTITIAQREHYGPNYFVTGVAAERGFGPFIYELAMMHLSKLGRGLMPTRDGDVRDVAFNVWKQFFNRPDIKKETMTIDNPYYRFDILGFSKDEFDSEEEIQEMLSELKDYQIQTLNVFNTSYSMDTDAQYNQLTNRAEDYYKSGFDIQVAIDKADEFWNNAYMS